VVMPAAPFFFDVCVPWKTKAAPDPEPLLFWASTSMLRSGYRGARGAVTRITLEEQRLTRYRRDHRRLERLRNQERRFRPLARQEPLWIGRDEDHGDLENAQQLVDGVQSRTAVRKLDICEDKTGLLGFGQGDRVRVRACNAA
jgi:hypothetical protein